MPVDNSLASVEGLDSHVTGAYHLTMVNKRSTYSLIDMANVELITLLLLSLVAILAPISYCAYQVYIALLGEHNTFTQIIGTVLPFEYLRAMVIMSYASVTNQGDSVFQVIQWIAVAWLVVVLVSSLSVWYIWRQVIKESATHNTR